VPSPESSRRNLELAKLRYRPPRPWRSPQESYAIRHLVWQWLTYRGPRKWSLRRTACWLNVSHVWVLKLVREFARDPLKLVREERQFGLATYQQLEEARRLTQEMRASGLLRPPWPGKYVKVSHPLWRVSPANYPPEQWPKRRWTWKAVPAKGSKRALRIPQEVPIWAASVYSMYANRWRAD
jgi:hypothetical protein